MTEEIFRTIICSKKCQEFVLLYDGLESRYFLYYNEDLVFDIVENLNPKDFHKQYLKYLSYLEFRKEIENELAIKIIGAIVNIIGDEPKKQRQIMAIYNDLIRTLKDAKVDPIYNEEHFANAPGVIIEKSRELSTSANYDDDAFDKILTPNNIEEEIKARANPILTNEEKAKADAIAKQIDKIGLLPYLKDILDNIHIGEHKNIYRKMLMQFKIMRGEASFLSETTAKAEAGKSFEDDIVFDLITPSRYIKDMGDITLASFVRYSLINPKYFDRVTLNFGDLGNKDAYKNLEPIFKVVKRLITKNKYNYIKSDKDTDTGIIEIPFDVDSIGAVYQTTKNSFTEDDDQLISRTLFSTPAIVENALIMEQEFYLSFSKSKQSKAKAKAEQDLKDFGLYLMQMVNTDIEIVNPYIDVFMEYALQSDNPIRELKQQKELFDAYCILTKEKCIVKYKGTIWASLEQLKEYMDYINLENALIPYEFDFLQMIMAKNKANELRIIDDSNAPGSEDLLTLTKCENYALELMGVESITDLTPNELKTLPYKLIASYGLRSNGIDHQEKVFFRYSDIKNLYGRYNAFKNVENVPKLLNTLYNKGYLGKYDYKHGKENLYYLTPLCDEILTKFEPAKTFGEYTGEFIANTGYENF